MGDLIVTAIIEGPLPPVPKSGSHGRDGAEVLFHGRVRATEHGKDIVALDYEHYPGMTETQLDALARETIRKFPIHDLLCHHRVGRIAVGETAMRLVIRSGHRTEAFEAMSWFISELKRRVPLWKWGVDSEGNRTPSSSGPRVENEPPP